MVFLLIHAIGHYVCTTGMYTLLSSMSIGYNDILNKKEKKSLTTMNLVFLLHC